MTPEEQSRNTLGVYIRRLRDERGWTQEYLAERSGLKRSDVDSIERGASTNPAAIKLARLAVGLDVPLADLLDKCGVPPKYLPKEPGRSRETIKALLERLLLEAPDPIPVYADHPFRAEQMGIEPVDYIYSGRGKGRYKIEAYYMPIENHVAGVSPETPHQDFFLVTRDIKPAEGDPVACLIKGKLVIGGFKNGRIIDDVTKKEYDAGECEATGVIIEIRRKYEKGGMPLPE